jgi:hypothetical protein
MIFISSSNDRRHGCIGGYGVYRYGMGNVVMANMGANTEVIFTQVPVPYPRRLSVGLSYTHTLTHLGEKSNSFCGFSGMYLHCIYTGGILNRRQ